MTRSTPRYQSYLRCLDVPARMTRAALLLGTIVLFTACSSSVQLNSQSLDREITVDGDPNEWHNVLRPTDKDQEVSVGAINDAEYLYLVVTTRNRDHIRSMVRSGLTTWFETGEGNRNQLGIRYPLGLAMEGSPQQGRAQRNPDALRAQWRSQLSELELLTPNAPAQRLPVEGVPGIRTAATLSSGLLIYEMQIPLQGSSEQEYVIGAAPGQTIKVAFETPEPEIPDMNQNQTNTRTASGGMTGRRGRRQAMPGGSAPTVARLDLETEIVLAQQ